MQKLILTMIVISNICVGFEVAIDYEDAWAEFGSLVTASNFHAGIVDGDNDSGEDADCDHCCHGAAHFTGAVATNFVVPFQRASSAIPLSDKAGNFASRSPPTPPPNA
jgi:hypothetical protein